MFNNNLSKSKAKKKKKGKKDWHVAFANFSGVNTIADFKLVL